MVFPAGPRGNGGNTPGRSGEQSVSAAGLTARPVPRLMRSAVYLARVIGTVVARVKYEGLEGQKLLIVERLNRPGEPTGEPEVAVDTVQAGHGDLVYCVASREAALACRPWFVPVDAAIVGIVDQLAVDARADRRDR